MREREVQRPAQADHPRQRPRRPAVGYQPEAGVGEDEPGAGGGHDEVGRGEERDPGPGRAALHGRDDGDLDRGEVGDRGVQDTQQLAEVVAERGADAGEAAHVPAGAEPGAGPGEQHDTHGRVGPDPANRVAERASQVDVDGVGGRGPVQGQASHPVADVDQHGHVGRYGHRGISFQGRSGSTRGSDGRPEDVLADDVALDLVGAAPDRHRRGGEEQRLPLLGDRVAVPATPAGPRIPNAMSTLA